MFYVSEPYFFWGEGAWTQGFAHARQVLYQLSYTSIPTLSRFMAE